MRLLYTRLLWTPSSTLAPARTRPVSEERELWGVRLLMSLLSGGSTRSVCSQMIVEKSSLNRLHREKIDTIPEFRRSGCSAPGLERQLSETSSPSLSVSLTSSSTLPRWLKVLLQIVGVYVYICIVLPRAPPTATQSRRRTSWSVWQSPTDKHWSHMVLAGFLGVERETFSN